MYINSANFIANTNTISTIAIINVSICMIYFYKTNMQFDYVSDILIYSMYSAFLIA